MKCDFGTIQRRDISSVISFFFNFLQRSESYFVLSPLPYVYSLILSYSWSLDSGSLSFFYFFKDVLKLSTQDFTYSSDRGLPSCHIRTTTSSLDFLSLPSTPFYRVPSPTTGERIEIKDCPWRSMFSIST